MAQVTIKLRILGIAALLITLNSASLTAQQQSPEILGNTVLQGISVKGTAVEIDSELQPLEINKIHSWLLKLRDQTGKPITSASIDFVGGMPEHDHGLPTLPQVTAEISPGVYLLEGMRFHMQGLWRLDIAVQWESEGATQRDKLTIDFDL